MIKRFKSFFQLKGKLWYGNWLFYFLIIALLGLLASVPLIINESYKRGGYITLWGASDALIYYGSFLTFSGSVLIGFVAIYMSYKANKINEKVTNMETKERKTFIAVDLEKPLDIFFKNMDPLFINKMSNGNINFNADFVEGSSDIILVEFYLKNISNNYSTGIYLKYFEILPDSEEKAVIALDCDADCSNLIAPNQSQKVVLLINGLKTYLNKEPLDYISNMCNFKFRIETDNLVQEKTVIEMTLFLEKFRYLKKIEQKSFKLSFDEYKILN